MGGGVDEGVDGVGDGGIVDGGGETPSAVLEQQLQRLKELLKQLPGDVP